MGTTFDDLLKNFIEVRDGYYRSDPDRLAATIVEMSYTLQAILEKLRDLHDPS